MRRELGGSTLLDTSQCGTSGRQQGDRMWCAPTYALRVRCPNCKQSDFLIEGDIFACQTVLITPASSFLVPPGVPGNSSAAAFPTYTPETRRRCGRVWTRSALEDDERRDLERDRERKEISSLKDPVEKLLRAIAHYATVRNDRGDFGGMSQPQVDFGSNQMEYWQLSGAMSRHKVMELSDEAIARWFARKARSVGLLADETVNWPEEKAPLFRQRRYGEPLKLRPGPRTEVWRIPGPLMSGRKSFLLRDGLIATNGRIGLTEGWPPQSFGEPALVYLAGRLGYPVAWRSSIGPAPTNAKPDVPA